jgi:hypothetical protein
MFANTYSNNFDEFDAQCHFVLESDCLTNADIIANAICEPDANEIANSILEPVTEFESN